MKTSPKKLFEAYIKNLTNALGSLSKTELSRAIDVLQNATTVYVAGNGGSAAIANHLCCDITKGTQPGRYIHTVSLVANQSILTAIANDLGYDQTISFQLNTGFDYLSDVLLLISSSGNSPNIVRAAREAKSRGHKVIGFTGFTGGLLREIADIKIHVASSNYGIVEDAHSAIMHCIAQFLRGSA